MDFKHTIIIVILSIGLIIFLIGFITGMLQNKKLMKHLSNQYEKLKNNKEVIDRLTSENGLLADSVVSLHSKNAILETDGEMIRATLSDTTDKLSQAQDKIEFWKMNSTELKEESRRIKIKATTYENRSKRYKQTIQFLTEKLLEKSIQFKGVEMDIPSNKPKPIFIDLDYMKP